MPNLNLPLGAVMLDIAGTSLSSDEIQTLSHPSVGAVILFARNYTSKAQLKALTAEIRAVRSPELLIAVDQEGGRVQRFQSEFTRLPPMAILGELYAKSPEAAMQQAEFTGYVMAKELVDCGVDFSFAPVLDVAVADSAVIGDRSFDANPVVITQLAGALITGMNAAGMPATGKHFPGHGNVCGDSHLELPVDQREMVALRALDMQPFAALSQKLGGVMTAHIAFPEIDPQLPTYSPFWLQNILRGELGFQGAIFSDDLTMQGACDADKRMQNVVTRAEIAYQAGCDMVLVCNAPEEAKKVLNQANLSMTTATQARLRAMQKTHVSHNQARWEQAYACIIAQKWES